MVKLEVGNSYKIVGIGTICDEQCSLSGDKATGYIEYCSYLLPVNLKLFGVGRLGEYAVYHGNFQRDTEKTSMWIIGSKHRETGEFSIAKKPKIHYNRTSADAEALRLARKHSEKKFIVFSVEQVLASQDVAEVDL